MLNQRRSRLAVPTQSRPTPASRGRSTVSPGVWILGGALVFFAVPFVGTDILGLQPDLFYLAYFTVAVAWFTTFAVTYRRRLETLWRHSLGYSLVVGAVAGAGLAAMILNQAGTDHPDGWQRWFEIGWRGVVYGTVDALVLFVLPAAAAYLLMHGNREGRRRKAGFAALALALSYLVTVTYHLGYTEFRNDTVRYPLIGATVAWVPTALTGNPLGGVVTHATMHVTAVVHQRNGGDAHMLPPRVTPTYPSHGDGDLAAGLAGAWLIVTAGALTLLVRRVQQHD